MRSRSSFMAPAASAGDRAVRRRGATPRSPAGALSGEHDWSPAIIGLCKAVEYETVRRLIDPLRSQLRHRGISEADLNDPELREVARYSNGTTERAPTLGTIARFITVALKS